jgi:hypothetical protein
VHEAIERSVSESETLLAELDSKDVETRLPLLVTGWLRGIAAALEELAIAVDDLQARAEGDDAPAAPEAAPRGTESQAAEDTEKGDRPAQQRAEADEEGLLEEARRSREETAEVREEARSELDEG